MPADLELMTRVAKMFYEDNLSQVAIARKVGISRFKVARLLSRARAEGIVQIRIVEPLDTAPDLECALRQQFGLKKAIVVSVSTDDERSVKQGIGRAAAHFLMEILEQGQTLGVSFGSTVREVISAIPVHHRPIHVVQITGSVPTLGLDVNPNELVRQITEKCRAEGHFLYAPAILNSASVRDSLLKEQAIKDTVRFYDEIDVALVGIAALYPEPTSFLVQQGLLGEGELNALLGEGVVGHIFPHFFDVFGTLHETDLNKRTVAISSTQLQKVPWSIAVAGGLAKAYAIVGAIRSRLVNTVVTDAKTATTVLEISRG
ncbi:MAG TPA: sugar-binding transcriptional regulator [Firmicutes bacterium]|nr:sugar-binding transcriptional regulator [Candidatus Fermentithermobacillaceae bacterium]